MDWYESEVQALERTSLSRVNGNHPPVFYGSSSIRLWDTLAEDFDPRVLNLGFGGATLEACDYFFARLVPPVNPRSLLLYAGDNDSYSPGRHVCRPVQRILRPGHLLPYAEPLSTEPGRPLPAGSHTPSRHHA